MAMSRTLARGSRASSGTYVRDKRVEDAHFGLEGPGRFAIQFSHRALAGGLGIIFVSSGRSSAAAQSRHRAHDGDTIGSCVEEGPETMAGRGPAAGERDGRGASAGAEKGA